MKLLLQVLCAVAAAMAVSPTMAADGPSCCERLGNTKFVPLISSQQYVGELVFGSDTFDFAEGYSPFAAFELPASGAARLAFVARFTGYGRSNLHMFCPTFTFLDANREILESVEPPLRYETNFFKMGRYRAQVDVVWGARFVILHTATATIGRRLAASEAPSQGFVYPMGRGLGYMPGRPR